VNLIWSEEASREAASIGRSRWRVPARQRHRQRVADELGAHVIGHAPADDREAVEVLHGDEVQPALPGSEVGDVGDPAAVRRARGEVTIKQVVGDPDAGTRTGVDRYFLVIRPDRPASRMSRSTRLRPICSQSSRTRSAQIRDDL
jgi:hypothetical protein